MKLNPYQRIRSREAIRKHRKKQKVTKERLQQIEAWQEKNPDKMKSYKTKFAKKIGINNKMYPLNYGFYKYIRVVLAKIEKASKRHKRDNIDEKYWIQIKSRLHACKIISQEWKMEKHREREEKINAGIYNTQEDRGN
jgi:hypothetical protein